MTRMYKQSEVIGHTSLFADRRSFMLSLSGFLDGDQLVNQFGGIRPTCTCSLVIMIVWRLDEMLAYRLAEEEVGFML